MRARHLSSRGMLLAAVAVLLATAALGSAAEAQVLVSDPLTITPSSGAGQTEITASLDSVWAAQCQPTFEEPLAVNLQTSETPGQGILNSALLNPADPSITLTADVWFLRTAYPAGTYWFVAFCPTADGSQVTPAVPFVVPTTTVPRPMALTLDPTSGTGGTTVTVTVGPVVANEGVPCGFGESAANVVVSRSSDVLDTSAVLTSTPIAAPDSPVTTSQTVSQWFGGEPSGGTYWFFASCPSVNNPAFTAYSTAVAFTVDVAPSSTVSTAPRAAAAGAVTPAFTG